MRKTWSKTFKFLRYSMIFDLAPRNTVWSIRPRAKRDSPNQRVDSLFGLDRVYISDKPWSAYVYSLKIGRVQIIFANRLQAGRK